MDELSIDSTTDEKVKCNPKELTQASNQVTIDIQNHDTKPEDEANKSFSIMSKDGAKTFDQQRRDRLTIKTNTTTKLHFTIDWRGLTYFQNHEQSFFTRSKKFSSQSTLLNSGKSSPDSTATAGNYSHYSNDYYRGRKRILNSLDGRFKSGQLNAILGPSGAGKTTFLSALFGNKQESAYGQTKVTWYNDSRHEQPVIKAQPKRPIKIAFLPQHDHLLHHLTVYETLMFASKIKNANKQLNEIISGSPKETDNPQKHGSHMDPSSAASMKRIRCNYHRQNVKRVAKMLKLTDCFNTKCGKLSGGQYKRVSIGQELLSEPDVIILDEPTSGLDAMTCLATIKTLKSIVTKRPMSIILTIHQPDIDVFNLFDQIYVIAQGGLAIYEGPPQEVAPTLASAGLSMPTATYNPARFIVENAFLIGTEANGSEDAWWQGGDDDDGKANEEDEDDEDSSLLSSSSSDEDDSKSAAKHPSHHRTSNSPGGLIRRSMVSLTEALGVGNLTNGGGGGGKTIACALDALGDNGLRDSGRRPLLNLGVQTSDGQLITSKQLESRNTSSGVNSNKGSDRAEFKRIERVNLLRRLNELQRSKYQQQNLDIGTIISQESSELGMNSSSSSSSASTSARLDYSVGGQTNVKIISNTSQNDNVSDARDDDDDLESVKSDYSSACDHHLDHDDFKTPSFVSSSSLTPVGQTRIEIEVPLDDGDDSKRDDGSSLRLQPINSNAHCGSGRGSTPSSPHDNLRVGDNMAQTTSSSGQTEDKRSSPSHDCCYSNSITPTLMTSSCMSTIKPNKHGKFKLRRQFDKRLSAKHNNAKQHDDPIWYHTFLLTHRTWLSISRDPVFFGIQFCMHTTIPILLALIFGSSQEEGCPRVGHFDLVDFAYSDSEDFIQGTVRSIRQSIGNIGVVFFEMFVLSFAINCITALVFPLDMFVLLKEYRNGWYSLRSYFFGRTLADLPVPIVLHSMAMTILYLMTGQPLSWSRFGAIIGIVILASLVAQSVGLTIGALLMRSSQSAVLAAAGIVAPFFALSGFIVRIHTLPWIAQFFANTSYLYHLLNGFIILRYGFDRCPCQAEDFEPNPAHQMPKHLQTMASIWVGTYSDEYARSSLAVQQQAALANKTQNVDPNIDLVEKLMNAFKASNSYGHKVDTCADVLPYAMLDFNLHDQDIYWCITSLVIMLIVSRFITFSAIYYKIRSFS